MRDLWETWVSDQTVDEFLADADDLIADKAFPDRRAAFAAYAGYVFSELGLAGGDPEFAGDGLGAAKLGDLLLAHAAAVEGRGRKGGGGPRRVRARRTQAVAARRLRDQARP
jgi:hypothetical protein